MEFGWIHQRDRKHHVCPHDDVVVEDEQRIQELRKRQVLTGCHDKVVEKTERMQHQRQGKKFLEQVGAMMFKQEYGTPD
jgi:hypothetical protein